MPCLHDHGIPDSETMRLNSSLPPFSCFYGVPVVSWHASCRYTAACSRSLVLKECLQLPTPLWREMLLLMGGPYTAVAEQEYEGDEVSGE